LNERSKALVVVNTHKGLFRYNCLPYGVISAPAIFPRTMEALLQGVPKMVVYLDNILISGASDEEHMAVLEKVLNQLQTAGLRLQQKKYNFL